jgi:hypothetical protein
MTSATRSRRPPGRYARGSTHRTQGLRRRQPPKSSGAKRMLSALVPGAAARKGAPSSRKGKAGGLALVAAAAGMAFRNRQKLAAMRRESEPARPEAPAA